MGERIKENNAGFVFHTVAEVEPIEKYILKVKFHDEQTRLYDMSPLIMKYEMFKPLEYVNGLFGQVKVDVQGYGICWNKDIDLSCNELYEHGTII
jgi:hypothetical protein